MRDLGLTLRETALPDLLSRNAAYERRIIIVMGALRAGASREAMREEHGKYVVQDAWHRLVKRGMKPK